MSQVIEPGSPPDEPVGRLWRHPAMLLLIGYTVTGFTGFFTTLSALPLWVARGGTPSGLAGQVTTVFLAATIATQLAVPRLVRRSGLAVILLVGLVALGLPSLGFLAGHAVAWVMALSLLRGIGFGIITVLGATLTAQIVPARRRGEAIGLYGLAIAVPNLIAVPAGVALVSGGHTAALAVLGAVPLLGVVTVPRLAQLAGRHSAAGSGARATPPDAASERAARSAARAASLAPTLVLLVVTLAGGGYLTYLPIERPEGALATSAVLVWGLVATLTRWLAGRVADRSGLGSLLPLSSVAAAAGLAVLSVGLALAPGAVGWAVILVGAAVFGAGYGGIQNLTLVAAFNRAPQEQAATVSAVWNIGFDAGTALGAAVVGALTTVVSVPLGLGLTVLPILAALPLAARSTRRTEHSPGPRRSPGQ